MDRIRTLLTLGIAIAAAALLQAQPPAAPPAQQPRPPVFKAGTSQVRVDVTVVDRKGDPITDLKKEDFDVREDGIPQSIDTLKLIQATGAAPDDDTSLPIRSPEHAAAEAARDDIRVFVIFWDEYHIGQMAPAIRAREALTAFVETAFGPTDLVALMDQLTPTDAIRFTRNRRELADRVHTLQGRQGVYLPPRSAVEEAQMYQGRDIEMLRSQVTATALESTIAFLGSLKEGRKTILFVSQTIGRVGTSQQDTVQWLDGAIRSANANNTTIYTLDPRGLNMGTMSSDILHALAEQTGGRQFASNFPAASLREIVKVASAFYLLGYSSAKNPADGKFHKIAVHVNRPGVEVKARTGYYAPSLAEMDVANKKASAAALPPEISKALEPLVDAPHVPIAGDFWAGARPGPDGTPAITVVWTARSTGGEAQRTWLRASGDDGHVYFDGPFQDRVTFGAAPGAIHLRLQPVEADGSRGDRQESSIDVPDFRARPIAITTPVLFRARTPLELRTLLADGDPRPFAGRQFERTDRVFMRFAVTGTGASDATVSAHLLSRQGVAMTALPMKSGPAGYEIEIPVASIARGEYIVALEASRGADRDKVLFSFRIN